MRRLVGCALTLAMCLAPVLAQGPSPSPRPSEQLTEAQKEQLTQYQTGFSGFLADVEKFAKEEIGPFFTAIWKWILHLWNAYIRPWLDDAFAAGLKKGAQMIKEQVGTSPSMLVIIILGGVILLLLAVIAWQRMLLKKSLLHIGVAMTRELINSRKK